MKIAMYGHKKIPSREGGVEIVVEELATRMSKMGNSVVCYNRSSDLKGERRNLIKRTVFYHGVKLIHVLTIRKKGLAALTSSFVAAYRASKSSADVIHVHAEGPAATCGFLKLRHKRVIVTIHGLDWQRAKWGKFAKWYLLFGEKQAARHADEIIVLSRNMQRYFLEKYGRKTNYIPNGVRQQNRIPAEEIASCWNLKENAYVLFVGRLVPEKGLMALVKAWKKVVTDKKLVIVGESSDTEEFCRELRAEASDNAHILFTGFVQGKPLQELFSNAYCYVLPSEIEGMPISLLEAMSYGNCCLVSSISECTEVIEDKAVVFEKLNCEDLREKLQMLLDHPEVVSFYKKESAEYITKKYDWDCVVNKTLELYQDKRER